jgi:hypothetical protein
MASKLIRLTHKIAIQLHLVAEPGGQAGKFWIHPRTWLYLLSFLTHYQHKITRASLPPPSEWFRRPYDEFLPAANISLESQEFLISSPGSLNSTYSKVTLSVPHWSVNVCFETLYQFRRLCSVQSVMIR